MKRIGYQDRWVPSMCGLIGDHCFPVGRVCGLTLDGWHTHPDRGEDRLVIGPVAGPKDGSE
jgi:hypothetical protein